jgi:hypothetical protein
VTVKGFITGIANMLTGAIYAITLRDKLVCYFVFLFFLTKEILNPNIIPDDVDCYPDKKNFLKWLTFIHPLYGHPTFCVMRSK